MYPKYKFIIVTTCIINGETALKELLGPGTDAEDQGLLVGDILRNKWYYIFIYLFLLFLYIYQY